MLLDNRDDIVPAVPCVEVLVDCRPAKKLEAELMVLLGGHDDVWALGIAPDEVRTLDGGAGRAPPDDASALEHPVEFVVGEGPRI